MLLSYFTLRPISEDELKHLREQRYAAISDKQALIDQKLQVEVRHFTASGSLQFQLPSFYFIYLFFFVNALVLFWHIFHLQHCIIFLFCNFLFCVCFHLFISAQLEAQEEKLKLEEEARNAAQREAARLARERKMKEVRRQ